MNYLFIIILIAIVVYFYIMNIHPLLEIFSINKNINKHKAKTSNLSEFCMENILTKKEAGFFAKQVKKDLADQYNTEDKKNIDNVYGTSFLNGYYAEMKDPKNKTKTVDEIKQIVLKNMVKDINYYAKNAMFGTKGVGFKTEKLTIAPKGKYKSSGYGDLDKKKK